jgi:hypothetical protein
MLQYLFGLLRPLALVVAVVAALFVAMQYVETNQIQIGYGSKPLDHAGPVVPCTKCPEPRAKNIGGFKYRCEACGMEFECRMNNERPGYIYTPDLRNLTPSP